MDDRPGDDEGSGLLREGGAQVLGLIERYWVELRERPESRAVFPPTAPGQVRGRLPAAAPEEPEPWPAVMRDVDELIVPHLTHWQHPSFFAYFPGNVSAPGVLGDLLASGLGVNAMLWATSPAATELEEVMIAWMGRLLGLPESLYAAPGGGCIQGTASEATLVALLAARDRARRRLAAAGRGPRGPWRAYTSAQAHSSVVKAAMIAGLATGPGVVDAVAGASAAEGVGGIRLIETDERGRMDVAALREALRDDARAGFEPVFVGATAGTTGLGAFDDVPGVRGAIEAFARERPGGAGGAGGEAGMPWLHVDAAWAGAAWVCPALREATMGGAALRGVDSVCVNPHKWLLTNFDCDLFFVADPSAVTGALSIRPEYLRSAVSDAGAAPDFRDWGVPLGRRFRALKLWMVLRHYGARGLRRHVRGHVEMAAALEAMIAGDERFELAVPRGGGLTLVCLRLRAGDGPTRGLLSRVNASGEALLTPGSTPDGRAMIRVAIGGTFTRGADVERLWRTLRKHADGLGQAGAAAPMPTGPGPGSGGAPGGALGATGAARGR